MNKQTKMILGAALLGFGAWYLLKDKIGGGSAAPGGGAGPGGSSSGGGSGAYSPTLNDVNNPYLVPTQGTAVNLQPSLVTMQPINLGLNSNPPITISGI